MFLEIGHSNMECLKATNNTNKPTMNELFYYYAFVYIAWKIYILCRYLVLRHTYKTENMHFDLSKPVGSNTSKNGGQIGQKMLLMNTIEHHLGNTWIFHKRALAVCGHCMPGHTFEHMGSKAQPCKY